jgi:hypothetical protein
MQCTPDYWYTVPAARYGFPFFLIFPEFLVVCRYGTFYTFV